ncbi:MAG: DUF3455 domain-containing protein [Polaromonas sp.]|nr:DUF3455 domain-containing protein [Polaromonas sp.]MDP3752457.1 DUF3455 domain-containing protein [Polaromonas sp.]
MMIRTAMATATVALIAACASTTPVMPSYSQAALPAAVQVPTGNKVALETIGVGEITYQCSAKKDMAGQFEWVFAGPDARLLDRSGKQVGKYYGPPATWEAMDGSKLTAVQLAVAPHTAGSIPLQLVKGNPAMGAGAMQGVTYIQRVNTQGGVAPAAPCTAANLSVKQIVKYQADYIFYKAM